MKIALIMTKGNAYKFSNRSVFFKYMPDCLTMGMLYAIIEKAFPEIEIEVYDETVERVEKEKITADLVGISAMTPTANRAFEYAQYFKSKNIPVFIGGVHPTLVPEETSKHCESVVCGLANESLVELINDFKNGEMKKFYTQKPDLSFSGFVHPKRDLYEKKHLLGTEINMVQATYGCSNVCEFCVQPYVCNGYHQRPVEEVVDEISKIKDDYVEFLDPNLSKDESYLKALCEKLIPLNKKWFAPMTISVVKNEELLALMQKAGCREILIGFESINSFSISSIKKGFNCTEKYKSAVRKLHEYGIKVTGSFVLGLDGDDETVEKNTLDFINEANIDYVRFTINTPYPGTKYFKEMQKQGRIIENNYSFYDCQNCVIKPAFLTPEKVEEIHRELWRKAYSLKNIRIRLSYIKPFFARWKMILTNYFFGKIYQKMLLREKAFIKNIQIWLIYCLL